MATLKQRLWRKNNSGSYDSIYLQTSSDMVLRDDGTTVENTLSGLGALASKDSINAGSDITAGTLPVARGGTGRTTMSYKNAVPIGNASTVTNAMGVVRSASGAFYSTGQDVAPKFGTLPVAQGGTGSTTAEAALTALGAAASSHEHSGADITSGTVAAARLGIMSAASSSAAGASGAVPAPAAGAQSKFLRGDGTWQSTSNTIACAYCSTAAATAAKTASCSGYALLSKSWLIVTIVTANSAASAITLNVNSKGAKPIYINGAASSASNYTLPAGPYLVYFDGTAYQFRTDGIIPGTTSGNAAASHSHAAADVTSGSFGVARGGTGRATLTANAVLAGNTTSAVKMIATASGALYATAANGAPVFGTLPIAQGGTGKTTAADAIAALGGLPLAGGTMTGNATMKTGTDYTTYRARNIGANTTAFTAGTTALTNGNIYLQYE